MTADERLLQFLKDGKDWERKPTNLPGVFLLRLPAFKGRSASIAVEVNPVGLSGSPMKKRGIVLRSSSELEEINRLLSNPKLSNLAKNIDEVNPEKKSYTNSAREDIFEV
jgi:hypothetical protein